MSPYDPISQDPPPSDAAYPAGFAPVAIGARDGQPLFARVLVAAGKGPHPLAVFLHGYPGSDQNFDWAHAVRRAGWNAVVFNYRGAWGSGGDFSVAHALEDAGAVLDFLSRSGNAEAYRLDPARIALIGHSMGGFVALQAAALDPRVRSVAAIAPFNLGAVGRGMRQDPQVRAAAAERMEATRTAIRGATGETLAAELCENAEAWDLLRIAPALAGKPVLLAFGERDEVSLPAVHHHPLLNALREAPRRAPLREERLEDEHYFSSSRVLLARKLVEWLLSEA